MTNWLAGMPCLERVRDDRQGRRVRSAALVVVWHRGGQLKRVVIRWGLAVAISVAAFAAAWWVCQEEIPLDEGTALAIAGAVLALVLAVVGWWAAREDSGQDSSGVTRRPAVQKARAGRDVNIAGRDQTIINYQRRDQ
jgi:hypothetical protein